MFRRDISVFVHLRKRPYYKQQSYIDASLISQPRSVKIKSLSWQLLHHEPFMSFSNSLQRSTLCHIPLDLWKRTITGLKLLIQSGRLNKASDAVY
jgi:hypothetical protein